MGRAGSLTDGGRCMYEGPKVERNYMLFPQEGKKGQVAEIPEAQEKGT